MVPEQSAARTADAGCLVLIVDDEEIVGSVLERVLRQQGCAVVRARSVGQALEITQECLPHVAILDLCLPDGDGAQLGNTLHARFPQLPLVLMTAYPQKLGDDPVRVSKFACILHKPLDLAVFRGAVTALLPGLRRTA
jgi:two-component system response regulator PilR (NtrC family)